MKKGIIFVFVLSLILAVPLKEVSAKTYWATGGGIGAAVGGLGGGIIMLAGCNDSGGDDPENWCPALIPVGVVGGGAVGFGLGAAIGAAFKKKAPVVQTIIDPTTGTYGAGVRVPF